MIRNQELGIRNAIRNQELGIRNAIRNQERDQEHALSRGLQLVCRDEQHEPLYSSDEALVRLVDVVDNLLLRGSGTHTGLSISRPLTRPPSLLL